MKNKIYIYKDQNKLILTTVYSLGLKLNIRRSTCDPDWVLHVFFFYLKKQNYIIIGPHGSEIELKFEECVLC